jgi:CDP-diacylglycerol---serine O-phosphatidyltransferase
MVLDGLDGRVARLTNTQSAFGAEYDSLSDMVSFGVAPALVMYSFALKAWASWAGSPPLYTAPAAALRLARFNTMLAVQDKRWFHGAAQPGGGGAGRGFVWLMVDNQAMGNARIGWPG